MTNFALIVTLLWGLLVAILGQALDTHTLCFIQSQQPCQYTPLKQPTTKSQFSPFSLQCVYEYPTMYGKYRKLFSGLGLVSPSFLL